ncbi:MAG: DUF1772 domain-containing protein [Roseovarius sp.]|jgi:membrane protease YdiL (CAAX protease family)|nr:DUF1772 domain-containing protein [Roseovarius sp.]
MTALRVLAICLMALILIPSGAHLFELPHKMALDRESYFTVQGIYAGWSLFGAPILAAILTNLGLCLAERRVCPRSARWTLMAAVLTIASLVVFFTWVFPANQATDNWTTQLKTWEVLRRNWEYGHAANAALLACALVATAMAVVRRSRSST